ncbi:MAG: hypothetical protein ACE5I5_03035 [Candidatus Heimdallarchaeota archaeon]
MSLSVALFKKRVGLAFVDVLPIYEDYMVVSSKNNLTKEGKRIGP